MSTNINGSKIKIAYNHTIFTPTTGTNITMINNQYNIINPTGAIASLTITLPASPVNNDIIVIKFTQAITTITYAGGTVQSGLASAVLGSLETLTYDLATLKWY